MAKIVLDHIESQMALFFKLFFDATRKLGLSDKEACEAFKESVAAIENAQAEERCAWYGSAEHIKLRVETINDKK